MNLKLRKTAVVIIFVLIFSILPIGIHAEQIAEPGTVRILLTDLQLARRIDIGIYGSYLLNDRLGFQSGSRVTVTANQNKIFVYYEGATLISDTSLIFKRFNRSGEAENGLRINDGLSLFEGDLHVSLSEQGLRAILHIGIEDYLKGVVPYEMNESFPFEALKAQAIAARSYTIRGLRSNRDYDLTDDTNDQVYKGFNKENNQAALAVSETEGMALAYGEEIARTYYTASNGGQTESSFNAWGNDFVQYLSVREDPFDMENPDSLVKEIKISKQWKADSQQAIELELYLKNAIGTIIASSGYDTNPNFIQINEIVALSAVSPKYTDSSLLMTQLHMSISVSGRRKEKLNQENEVSLFTVDSVTPIPSIIPSQWNAWGPIEEIEKPVEVILDIFPHLEKLLGLSINQKENELIRVIEEQEAFILRSSRYGHGVGLSQRGSEWMAKQYGKDCSYILTFYYPGTVLKRFMTVPASRPLLGIEFMATPGPVPTATPRPTLIPQSIPAAPNQWEVIITGINRNSSLNLRLLPSLTGDVINQLFYGQRLLVLKRIDEQWLQVRADGVEGYVMESFVQRLP